MNDPIVKPICIEGTFDNGFYAIKQPDGRFCFPEEATVNTEEEAIKVFEENRKMHLRLKEKK